jgi:hypothetical protein
VVRDLYRLQRGKRCARNFGCGVEGEGASSC